MSPELGKRRNRILNNIGHQVRIVLTSRLSTSPVLLLLLDLILSMLHNRRRFAGQIGVEANHEFADIIILQQRHARRTPWFFAFVRQNLRRYLGDSLPGDRNTVLRSLFNLNVRNLNLTKC